MTPAATDTFSDGTLPSIGMETRKSHFLATRSWTPLPSDPRHDGAIHVVVERVVTLGAALVQPHDPQIFVFQFFQRPGDVGHFSDGKVLAGAGGCLDHCRGHARRTAFRDHHSVGAGGVGGAKNRAQIVRVFNSIQHHHQRILPALGGHHVVQMVVLFARSHRHHALMSIVSRHAVEFRAATENAPRRRSAGIPPPRAVNAGRDALSTRRPIQTIARVPSALRRQH